MEGREIRILVEFEHDEPDPSFRVLAAEALPLVGEGASQLVFGRPLGSGCLIGARDGWANLLADHLAKEFFLAAEVEGDGSLGDAGARGDFLELCGVNPVFRKHAERGIENLVGALLWEPSPSRIVRSGVRR